MKLNGLNINSLPTPVLENARLMQELRDLRQDYKNLEEGNYNESYRGELKIELEKAKERIKGRIEELVEY